MEFSERQQLLEALHGVAFAMRQAARLQAAAVLMSQGVKMEDAVTKVNALEEALS